MSTTVRERRRTHQRREWLVTIFAALSDPTRVEMLEMILDSGEIGCSRFDEYFSISKSTISYHVKVLNAAGLIETRREGRFFYYSPKVEEIEANFPGLLDQLRGR